MEKKPVTTAALASHAIHVQWDGMVLELNYYPSVVDVALGEMPNQVRVGLGAEEARDLAQRLHEAADLLEREQNTGA